MSGRVEAFAIDEGDRVGRFVVLRDRDGNLVAIAPGAVNAVCETEDGNVLIQFGGKMTLVDQSTATVLAWLDGGQFQSRPAASMPVKPVRTPFKLEGETM